MRVLTFTNTQEARQTFEWLHAAYFFLRTDMAEGIRKPLTPVPAAPEAIDAVITATKAFKANRALMSVRNDGAREGARPIEFWTAKDLPFELVLEDSGYEYVVAQWEAYASYMRNVETIEAFKDVTKFLESAAQYTAEEWAQRKAEGGDPAPREPLEIRKEA